MDIRHILAAALAMAIPTIAHAGTAGTVPEPETVALAGIGALALVIARRAKKK